jgi:hypothetical protein
MAWAIELAVFELTKSSRIEPGAGESVVRIPVGATLVTSKFNHGFQDDITDQFDVGFSR